jgi:hypothetical protein
MNFNFEIYGAPPCDTIWRRSNGSQRLIPSFNVLFLTVWGMFIRWLYHVFSIWSFVSSVFLMMLVAAHTIKRRITGWLMVAALERIYVEGSGRGLGWISILVRPWSERRKSRKSQLGLLVCGSTWIREGTFIIKSETFREMGRVKCGIYGVLRSRFAKLQMLLYELF